MLSVWYSSLIFVGLIFFIILFFYNSRGSIPYERFFNYPSYWCNYFPIELINPKEAKKHNDKKEAEIQEQKVKYPHSFTHLYYGSKIDEKPPVIDDILFNDGYYVLNKNNQLIDK